MQIRCDVLLLGNKRTVMNWQSVRTLYAALPVHIRTSDRTPYIQKTARQESLYIKANQSAFCNTNMIHVRKHGTPESRKILSYRSTCLHLPDIWILWRWWAQPSIRQCWLCSYIVLTGLVLAASLKSEATWHVVVKDPGNLHEGVDRCRANTMESSAHLLAYGFSFRRLCRHLASMAEEGLWFTKLQQ